MILDIKAYLGCILYFLQLQDYQMEHEQKDLIDSNFKLGM